MTNERLVSSNLIRICQGQKNRLSSTLLVFIWSQQLVSTLPLLREWLMPPWLLATQGLLIISLIFAILARLLSLAAVLHAPYSIWLQVTTRLGVDRVKPWNSVRIKSVLCLRGPDIRPGLDYRHLIIEVLMKVIKGHRRPWKVFSHN